MPQSAAALYVGGSKKVVHVLRGYGAEAICSDDLTPEAVIGRHVVIAPSAAKRNHQAIAVRDAKRALEFGAKAVAIIAKPPIGLDVADYDELANGHASLAKIEACAQPVGGLEYRAQLSITARGDQAAVAADGATPIALEDLLAYMPLHKYIFRPTGELWPAESVNGRVQWPTVASKPVKPSAWLDQYQAVEQMTWDPGEPQLIRGKLVSQGGWISHDGCRVFNRYRAPSILSGDPSNAGPWRDHLRRIYPESAEHIECWLAHRVQHPGEKINHAIVMQGSQGVGKDTLLEPVKYAVGPWNWQEISPSQLLARFNGWAQAVVVRISEARDLGDFDRFAFFDHSKVYMAAPPDVLRVDEKHVHEFYVPNIMGVIITTNHETDALYLEADDRRHYVAASEVQKEDLGSHYFNGLWRWYAEAGFGDVAAYLRTRDLTAFNAKAPPPKTEAFWRIVHANAAPESAELAGLIEGLSNPEIVTLSDLIEEARRRQEFSIIDFLSSLKTRRQVQHRLQSAGYIIARNQDRKDGLWRVNGRRQMVYALRKLTYSAIAEIVRRRNPGQ